LSTDIKVVAQNVGDQYNVAAGTYSVAGQPTLLTGLTSVMGGGTTKFIKVVTQADVDGAREKILKKAADNVKGQLTAQLTDEKLTAFTETYTSSVGTLISSVAVDNEAVGDVTVTIEITATMLGARTEDLDKVVTNTLQKSLDSRAEKAYATGIDKAVYVVKGDSLSTKALIDVASTAKVGPILDKDQIRTLVAGQKAGEAKKLIEAKSGVKEVQIRLSPFWVFSIPKNNKKITVNLDEGV
jgi:hypothetical protein